MRSGLNGGRFGQGRQHEAASEVQARKGRGMTFEVVAVFKDRVCFRVGNRSVSVKIAQKFPPLCWDGDNRTCGHLRVVRHVEGGSRAVLSRSNCAELRKAAEPHLRAEIESGKQWWVDARNALTLDGKQ